MTDTMGGKKLVNKTITVLLVLILLAVLVFAATPLITLNNPPNGSSTTNNYQLLNFTPTDADNDNTTVKLLGYFADEIDASEETDLVLLLHLNNDSDYNENSSFVYDFSSYGNNGTCTTCPTFKENVKFKGGYQYETDTSQSFTIPHSASLQLTTPFTISAWINYSRLEYWDVIVAKENSTSSPFWFGIDNTGSNRLAFLPNEYDAALYSTGSITENQSYHVAMVYNGTHAYFYIDGVQDNIDGPYATPLAETTNSVYIGYSPYYSADNTPDGTIDEVAIWNRSLNAQEILSLYDKGRYKTLYQEQDVVNGTAVTYSLTSMPLSVDKDMVLLMHFDNDSSVGENDTHTYDWTNLGNNGTCSGSVCPTMNVSGGQFAGGYKFDGSDDYIRIDDDPMLDLGGDFTISAWINPASFGENDQGRIVDKNGGVGDGWSFHVDNNTPTNALSLQIDGAEFNSNNNSIELNKWQLVTVILEGSTASFYVDGVFINSVDTGGNEPANPNDYNV
ncbi:LamG domain-containing protein, partial [Candidatus Woesearchaeota archaeon]|nr:LamG domain-containing protein [Candidatus Woesearchaeota archaeon]